MAGSLGGSLGTWRGGRMQGEGLAGRDGEQRPEGIDG